MQAVLPLDEMAQVPSMLAAYPEAQQQWIAVRQKVPGVKVSCCSCCMCFTAATWTCCGCWIMLACNGHSAITASLSEKCSNEGLYHNATQNVPAISSCQVSIQTIGQHFHLCCKLVTEIRHWVHAANGAFQQLRQARSSGAWLLSVKLQFCQCVIMAFLLCSAQTWAVVQLDTSASWLSFR